MRETATGRFDTPERRAGLEARIKEVTSAIAHEAVRKYYRQDLEARLRDLFAPQGGKPGFAGRFQERGQGPAARPVPRQAARTRRPFRVGGRADEPGAVEPAAHQFLDRARLAVGAAGARGADPARPDQSSLAARHPCEEVAAIEFLNPTPTCCAAPSWMRGIHAGFRAARDLRALIAEREHGALLARHRAGLDAPRGLGGEAGAAPTMCSNGGPMWSPCIAGPVR